MTQTTTFNIHRYYYYFLILYTVKNIRIEQIALILKKKYAVFFSFLTKGQFSLSSL